LILELPPNLSGFAWTSFVIELTPGPNMTTLALLAATYGRRAGLAAVAGVALGLGLVGLAAAMGLATLIANAPLVYEALRWFGFAYLLYLAWEGWRGASDIAGDPTAADDDHAFFRKGLLTNLLNPKAAVFYVSIQPMFIDPARAIAGQSVVLTLTYVAIASLIHTAIVLLAARVGKILADTAVSQNVVRTLSVLLAIVALWLLWTTRRTG
jgi:threonine/homoserine/homoserine lactone efflux protein